MQALSGDIGGTRSRLRISSFQSDAPETLFQQTYENRDFNGPEEVIDRFIEAYRSQVGKPALECAVLGVAGPVFGHGCHMTNLPWYVDAETISRKFSIPRVVLQNDLSLAAHGIGISQDHQTVIQAHEVKLAGPAVVIGVGTGLGQATLLDREQGREVIGSEAGHMHFCPGNRFDLRMLEHLWESGISPCNETLLSGAGLVQVHRFVLTRHTAKHDKEVTAPGITSLAARGDRIALEAIDRFSAMLGTYAGNAALQCMAVSGVYLLGGVAAALARAGYLARGPFLSAFTDKGQMSTLMECIPVIAVESDDIGLAGASRLLHSIMGCVTVSGDRSGCIPPLDGGLIDGQ